MSDENSEIRDVISQLKWIKTQIEKILSEIEREKLSATKGHPLYNIGMAVYWLSKIDGFDLKGNTIKKGV